MTGVDTSSFAKEVVLFSLKSDMTNLDINELKPVPTYLNSVESKRVELDIDKLKSVPVDLEKLN